MLFEVGSLKFYFCDWNTAFVHAFLFLAALSSARSLDCCQLFLAFKALSASFSWSFSIYFFFPRATVGTQSTSNSSQSSAGSPKTKCLLQTHSLSSTLLFVASPRLLRNRRNPLVSFFSRELLRFFSLICSNLR